MVKGQRRPAFRLPLIHMKEKGHATHTHTYTFSWKNENIAKITLYLVTPLKTQTPTHTNNTTIRRKCTGVVFCLFVSFQNRTLSPSNVSSQVPEVGKIKLCILCLFGFLCGLSSRRPRRFQSSLFECVCVGFYSFFFLCCQSSLLVVCVSSDTKLATKNLLCPHKSSKSQKMATSRHIRRNTFVLPVVYVHCGHKYREKMSPEKKDEKMNTEIRLHSFFLDEALWPLTDGKTQN